MSDSEDSIDNQIIARIVQRRANKKRPTKKGRKTKKEPEPEPEPMETKPVEPTPEAPTEDIQNTIEKINTEPEPKPEPEPEKLVEEQKLEKAHTEAKRLKRQQTRGEVKPSAKVQKIIRRRTKKEDPEPEEPSGNDLLLEEMRKMREEISFLKSSMNHSSSSNQSVLSDTQSALLMGLMGRR